MENLLTIVIFIVIVLVKGLSAKKQSERNRPVRRQHRTSSAAPSVPDYQPVPLEEELSEELPASLEEWLKKMNDLEDFPPGAPKAPPASEYSPEPRPAVQTPASETPVMSEKVDTGLQQSVFTREELLRESEQVVEQSVDAALPDMMKNVRHITAPKMHPVRVSTKNLRQAVIMSEVLARPRAFDL